MNEKQYETAVLRLLEQECDHWFPLLLLMCGPPPNWHKPLLRYNELDTGKDAAAWGEWRSGVDRFLFETWGWKSGPSRQVATDIFAHRYFTIEYERSSEALSLRG